MDLGVIVRPLQFWIGLTRRCIGQLFLYMQLAVLLLLAVLVIVSVQANCIGEPSLCDLFVSILSGLTQ